MNKYGIKSNVIGVYSITNLINGKKYVGSSNRVLSRFSTHFNRDRRNHPHRPMYAEMNEYGIDNFKTELLEECEVDELINREIYWYDKLNPEYNFSRPTKNPLQCESIRNYGLECSMKPSVIEARKKLYNTPEYIEHFRNMHIDKMKPVELIELELKFKSISAGSRWVTENTTYKSKNKASKIKAVCDGERKTAYGYTWRYC